MCSICIGKIIKAALAGVLLSMFVCCVDSEQINLDQPGDVDDTVDGDFDFTDDTGEIARTTVNLLNYARITADATRIDVPPWPREAEDLPSTLRDDNAGTYWKVPNGVTTTLYLDLMPTLHEEVAVYSIDMGIVGDIEEVTVQLLEECHGRAKHEFIWEPPFARMELDDINAGCIQLRILGNADPNFKSLKIVGGIRSKLFETLKVTNSVVDIKYPNSGIAEGFAGVPWSWEERRKMVQMLAMQGMGTYLYCPEWDVKHSEVWRTEYSSEEIGEFKRLMDVAGKLGVKVYIGISPFADFNYESSADYQLLENKMIQFIRNGARAVLVLANDIESSTGTDLDTKHLDIVNDLYLGLNAEYQRVHENASNNAGNFEMLFMPTVYNNEKISSLRNSENYLKYLGEKYSDRISVVWTGKERINETIDRSHFSMFNELANDASGNAGMKPVLWDNFWLNDEGDNLHGRILLGALTGRATNLMSYAKGIVQNTMIQGSLSRLLLGYHSYYLNRFGNADTEPIYPGENSEQGSGSENSDMVCAGQICEDMIEHAIDTEMMLSTSQSKTSAHDQEALKFIVELFNGNAVLELVDGTPKELPRHKIMDVIIEQLIEKIKENKNCSLADIRQLILLFARMATVDGEVYHSGLDVEIVDELEIPLLKVKYSGIAGLWILDAIKMAQMGEDVAESLDRAKDAIDLLEQNRFVFSEGKIRALYEEVLKYSPGRAMVVDRVQLANQVSSCTVGDKINWKPFVGGSTLELFGLPLGVTESESVVWQPVYGGRYIAVAVAMSKDDWAFSIQEFFCLTLSK